MKFILLTTKILLLNIFMVKTDNIIQDNLELITDTLDLPIGSHN